MSLVVHSEIKIKIDRETNTVSYYSRGRKFMYRQFKTLEEAENNAQILSNRLNKGEQYE
jgi:hypothetical protein